jgi:plastocyanin
MPGVTLLVSGSVFLACLAAPGALFASSGTDPAPSGEAPGVTPPEGAEPTEPEGDGGDPGGTAKQPATGEGGSPPATVPEPNGATNEVASAQPSEAGSGRGGQGAKAAATRTVAMRNIEFKPRNIRMDVGDTVRWENEDDVPHDALGEKNSFETPIIDGGESSEHSFDEAGKYPYFCSIHEGMTGRIQVGSSSTGGGGGSGDTSSGSGGTSGPGSTSSGSSGTSGTGSFGSSSSSGTSSSLPATGSDLLWLGLIGYGLLAIGAFVRLGAIGR